MNVQIRTPQRYELVKGKGSKWIRLLGPEPDSPPFPESCLTQKEADAIMEWCMQNDCGVRMSFDMWRFKTQEDMMVFLLKWC
jgi:hypothetical protein